MKKKLFSILLSLAMMISMMPAMTMTAFAANPQLDGNWTWIEYYDGTNTHHPGDTGYEIDYSQLRIDYPQDPGNYFILGDTVYKKLAFYSYSGNQLYVGGGVGLIGTFEFVENNLKLIFDDGSYAIYKRFENERSSWNILKKALHAENLEQEVYSEYFDYEKTSSDAHNEELNRDYKIYNITIKLNDDILASPIFNDQAQTIGIDIYQSPPEECLLDQYHVNLDLNGHKIDRKLMNCPEEIRGSYGGISPKDCQLQCIIIGKGSTLTIDDTSQDKSGKICGAYNYSSNNYVEERYPVYLDGGCICNNGTLTLKNGSICDNYAYSGSAVLNVGTFNMQGGKVCDNKSSNDYWYGGAIYNYGVFNLSAGEIKNNEIRTGTGLGIPVSAVYSARNSQAECVNNGEYGFYMTGGLITGNTGAVAVWNYSEASITGGKITGNRSPKAPAGVYAYGKLTLGGSAYIYDNIMSADSKEENRNVFIENNSIILAEGENAPQSDMKIGVTWWKDDLPIAVSAEASALPLFISDENKYMRYDSVKKAIVPYPHEHDFKYSIDANGDIVAACDNCPYDASYGTFTLTAKLSAPDMVKTDSTSAYNLAKIEKDSKWDDLGLYGFGEIKYASSDSDNFSTTAPTEIGKYKAKFTVVSGDSSEVVSSIKTFEIKKESQPVSKKVPVEFVWAKTSGKKAIKLSWNKVSSATKYVVYGAKCGKKTFKELKTVYASKIKTKKLGTYTVKKIAGKKLLAHRHYKFRVIAYQGSKKIATSKTIHFITGNTSGRYANVKSIKAKYDEVLLSVGGPKAKIGASYKMYKGKKHIKKTHGATLRYITNNPSVATVSKSGVVTPKGAGTATIYIQDIGGRYCKTTLTVEGSN